MIATTGQPKDYATCLTRLMELAHPPRLTLPAPGAWMTRSQLSRRVLALLDKRRNVTTRGSMAWTGITVALLIGITLGMFQWAPAIAFAAEPPSKAAPQPPVVPKAPKSPESPVPPVAPVGTESPAISQPPSAKQMERDLILEEIALVEELVKMQESIREKKGFVPQSEWVKTHRDLIGLKRQLTVLEGEIETEKKFASTQAAGAARPPQPPATTQAATKEFQTRLQGIVSERAMSPEEQKQTEAEKAELAKQLIEIARNDSDPNVRLSAVANIAFSKSDENAVVLGELAKNDTENKVRLRAFQLLAGFHTEASARELLKLLDA